MRWFCKCVETWWPVLLDEIICMTRISWITQSVISLSARPDGGDGEMEARARSGLQDGRMVLACLGYCLPPPCLPALLALHSSTWLLHQYNNELDIEGLLSAGESWPLMPRFGHLSTVAVPLCATASFSSLARTDRERFMFTGIT